MTSLRLTKFFSFVLKFDNFGRNKLLITLLFKDVTIFSEIFIILLLQESVLIILLRFLTTSRRLTKFSSFV